MRWISPATTAMAAGGYAAVVAVSDPFRASVFRCPVFAITGMWCPGCGSTRAVHALTEGDVGLSLRSHPLVVPVIALLGFLWWRWVRRDDTAALRLAPAVPLMLTVAFVALTIARNTGLLAGPPLLA